jgi:hypothetical protein
MNEMTPFERQVEHELHAMVGPIPRFDAVEIAETAVARRRRGLHWPGLLRRPRALDMLGLAAAVVALVLGIGIIASLLPRDGEPVRIEGKGSYTSVGSAVAAAVDGDVVLIRPGVYEETVEVTRDITIRGDSDEPDAVMFRIPSDGPSFRLREADATLSDITFLSIQPDDGADRRQAIDVVGGVPTLEGLVARADAPVEWDFVRLYETGEGSVVRGNTSSGDIRANRGAQVLIEGNVLLREDPDGPAVGITLERADVTLDIRGNDLNYVGVFNGHAELAGNEIHGSRSDVPAAESLPAGYIGNGSCAVYSLGASRAVLTDNRIFDNGTGICGSVEIVGGEIFDNDVGYLVETPDPLDPRDVPIVSDAVIRDNAVGILAGESAAVRLVDVAFCGNGVDIEAPESADVERSGSATCES